jgi:L-threonylcarbamoyladenylate synthase
VTRIVTDIDDLVAALDHGMIVGFATDTVYGIAASVRARGAATALSDAKGRSAEVPLQVLVCGLEQVRSLAILSERAGRVASRLWPGAVTLVLARNGDTDLDLGPALTTVGLRWPADTCVNELCERCGPLLATSANRHGEEPAVTAAQVADTFADAVAVVLDGGTRNGSASTVVDLTVEPPVILRAGAVSEAMVRKAL